MHLCGAPKYLGRVVRATELGSPALGVPTGAARLVTAVLAVEAANLPGARSVQRPCVLMKGRRCPKVDAVGAGGSLARYMLKRMCDDPKSRFCQFVFDFLGGEAPTSVSSQSEPNTHALKLQIGGNTSVHLRCRLTPSPRRTGSDERWRTHPRHRYIMLY